jgi:hypothetical protein
MVIQSTARVMSLGGKVMCGLRMVLPPDLGLGGPAQVRVRGYALVDAVYTDQLSAVWVERYSIPAHAVYMWYRYMRLQWYKCNRRWSSAVEGIMTRPIRTRTRSKEQVQWHSVKTVMHGMSYGG